MKKIGFWLTAAFLSGLLVWTLWAALSHRSQWDLKVYMGCSRTMAQGENPYRQDQFVDGVSYPCLYVPIILDAYRPFAKLCDATRTQAGRHLWSLLKVLAAAALIFIWGKWFIPLRFDLYPAIFLALAYGGPFLLDFRCGNAASFEQLLLWAGFAALVSQRDWLFGGLIALAALVKFTPLAFLGLLLLRPKPRWTVFAGSLALFTALMGLNQVLHPGLLSEYLRQLSGGDQAWHYEGGPNNCSTFAFLEQGFEDLLAGRARATLLAQIICAPLAAAILWISVQTLRHLKTDKERILFSCLAYALVVPRMKDYTFILLLAPTFFILEAPIAQSLRWSILALAFLNSAKGLAKTAGLGHFSFLFAYFKLYAAALAWWAYVKSAGKTGKNHD